MLRSWKGLQGAGDTAGCTQQGTGRVLAAPRSRTRSVAPTLDDMNAPVRAAEGAQRDRSLRGFREQAGLLLRLLLLRQAWTLA